LSLITLSDKAGGTTVLRDSQGAQTVLGGTAARIDVWQEHISQEHNEEDLDRITSAPFTDLIEIGT